MENYNPQFDPASAVPKKFCGHCGYELKVASAFCPNCGNPVVSPAQPQAAPAAPASAVAPEEVFGQQPMQQPFQQPKQKKKGKAGLIIGIIAAVVVIAVVAGFLLLGNGGGSAGGDAITGSWNGVLAMVEGEEITIPDGFSSAYLYSDNTGVVYVDSDSIDFEWSYDETDEEGDMMYDVSYDGLDVGRMLYDPADDTLVILLSDDLIIAFER